MAKKFPIHPIHPERVCWGCDKYCPADSLACGNGSERTQHPAELFGDDWLEWGIDSEKKPDSADTHARILRHGGVSFALDEEIVQ